MRWAVAFAHLAQEPVVRTHDEAPGPVLRECLDIILRPRVVLLDAPPPMLLEDGQSLVGTNPHSVAAIHMHVDDTAAGQLRFCGSIEHPKLLPVEAHQAVEGAKPEVAVSRLCDRRRRVLRQTVVGLPVLHQERRAPRGIHGGEPCASPRLGSPGPRGQPSQSQSQREGATDLLIRQGRRPQVTSVGHAAHKPSVGHNRWLKERSSDPSTVLGGRSPP